MDPDRRWTAPPVRAPAAPRRGSTDPLGDRFDTPVKPPCRTAAPPLWTGCRVRPRSLFGDDLEPVHRRGVSRQVVFRSGDLAALQLSLGDGFEPAEPGTGAADLPWSYLASA